jgi:hypothetical protein
MAEKPNNVILLNSYRKKRGWPVVRPSLDAHAGAPVVDMTERRTEMINEERRQVKRTILTQFVGACIVVPQKGLLKVAIYDVSEDGLAFDMEEFDGHLRKGEVVAMRVYLNQYTYFPFEISVTNHRHIADEACYRHGVSFVKGTINDQALYHFIKFVETVSAALERDTGDIMVSNLSD